MVQQLRMAMDLQLTLQVPGPGHPDGPSKSATLSRIGLDSFYL
jgi:hypothetical protein